MTALLLLGACAAPTAPEPAATTVPASAAEPSAAQSPATVPMRQTPLPGEAIAAIVPPRPPATGDLVSLVAGDVRKLFGAPTLVRRESPAQVWQYASDTCVLVLFLYPEAAALPPGPPPDAKVRHAEILGRVKGRLPGESECLESLLQPGAASLPPTPAS